MKRLLLFVGTLIFLASVTVQADSVKINKTGTVYQNVKTSVEKGVVTVDFEDGSRKRFREKDVTVTKSEVVWLAKEEEEPGVLNKWFGSSKKDLEPSRSDSQSSEVAVATPTETEEPSVPYLAEGIFGGVALLFLLLP